MLAGAYVVRSALVSASGWGGQAGWLWPDHPRVTGGAAMREVAIAAAGGSEPARSTRARFAALAKADPLAPEPFLAEGALAVRRGDYRRAEPLLLHARTLEPRSPSARYLLADLYLRQGQPMAAMAEMSALNRLVPAGSMQLAQAFAQYSARAGAAPQVRAILSAYPELEDLVLQQLSSDARNAPLVLSLFKSGRPRSMPPPWLSILVATLIAAGEHRQAFEAWRHVSGSKGAPGSLFNPGFDASDAPPPFNWSFARAGGAVVEAGSGQLKVLYFGREDLNLAEQLLLLQPGTHHVSMQLSGTTGENDIRWSLQCIPDGAMLMQLPIRSAGPASALSRDFTVPAGCPVQRLVLRADGVEFPERAEFRISRLALAKAGTP